jgi:hypothetical protein
MSRDMSQGQGAAIVDHPGPEQMQARVDATELDAISRYRRLRDYSILISSAVRHADAMNRLDLALQLG